MNLFWFFILTSACFHEQPEPCHYPGSWHMTFNSTENCPYSSCLDQVDDGIGTIKYCAMNIALDMALTKKGRKLNFK